MYDHEKGRALENNASEKKQILRHFSPVTGRGYRCLVVLGWRMDTGRRFSYEEMVLG